MHICIGFILSGVITWLHEDGDDCPDDDDYDHDDE